MRKVRGESRRLPIASAACAVLAVVVAAGIFVLMQQDPSTTSSESSAINDFLVGLLGGVPFLYDPETDLWLGVGIRHWAHAAEFFAFGLFAALAAWFFARPRIAAAGGAALAVCVASSLFDQCHKLFVPGRHFDGFDLVMDALGYGVAIVLVLAVAWVLSRRGSG